MVLLLLDPDEDELSDGAEVPASPVRPGAPCAPASPFGPAGPAGPVAPAAPAAPVAPVGPRWFHVSSVSPAPQVWAGLASASMIRIAPVAVVMHEWIVPSADGIAAMPKVAPAPSATSVGTAIFRARLGEMGRMRPTVGAPPRAINGLRASARERVTPGHPSAHPPLRVVPRVRQPGDSFSRSRLGSFATTRS